MINPWKVLDVHRQSTDDDIRQAFLELAKKFHPDMKKGNADKFHNANLAYQMLKDKNVRRDLIENKLWNTPQCSRCDGKGCTAKSKGMTGKVYTACAACGGSGFNFKNQEEENVAIELHGTAGSDGPRRNKGRRPGASKQYKH